MMRKPILIIFLLQLLFLVSTGAEVDSKVPSFSRTKMLGVECTCDNPCGTPCSIPSLRRRRSPRIFVPFAPAAVAPANMAVPASAAAIHSVCSIAAVRPLPSAAVGGVLPPYYPWIYTPPGELYPQDPGTTQRRASTSVSLGRFATAAAAVGVGFWPCGRLINC
uniref:Uncharacterized protein n=1 Tax=Ananas comosus var. bracteatus TaxID=296719 RepID=A0A6V7QIW6_ANACO|nr:unnamed protein product [Ananas comosus var. bracteatus]